MLAIVVAQSKTKGSSRPMLPPQKRVAYWIQEVKSIGISCCIIKSLSLDAIDKCRSMLTAAVIVGNKKSLSLWTTSPMLPVVSKSIKFINICDVALRPPLPTNCSLQHSLEANSCSAIAAWCQVRISPCMPPAPVGPPRTCRSWKIISRRSTAMRCWCISEFAASFL